MSTVAFLNAPQYVADLAVKVRHAKRRVYIMTMIIADDSATHDLITAIETAAASGIEVQIAADTYEFSELGGHFSPFKEFAAESRRAKKMAGELQESGASFVWLGRGRLINPFVGVNHIKFAVVDDDVYAFGGVNLYKKGIRHIDYMFRLNNTGLADRLVIEYQNIIAAELSLYDGFRYATPRGTVLIDSGQPGESSIYELALVHAKKAQHITLVSQYCPAGLLVDELKRVNAKLYFNQPQHADLANRLLIWHNMRVSGLKSQYHKSSYLHAKFMIFTDTRGQKTVITGSHNFTHQGVQLGTKEIALETTQPEIIHFLEAFIKRLV